jgi:hypothetical protein
MKNTDREGLMYEMIVELLSNVVQKDAEKLAIAIIALVILVPLAILVLFLYAIYKTRDGNIKKTEVKST